MVVFPNAKINIGLHITEKRSDGYHNIETVFYPVKIYDALEILPHAEGDALEFTVSGEGGLAAGGLVSGEDNLCVRAYRLLEKNHSLPPVKMHLHKNIPSGAGLGGASSDAVHTLLLLDKLFTLGLSQEEFGNCARRLGSDCAFFLENRPVFAMGKGDEFSPAELDLGDHCLVVVMPEEVEVSTAQAYAGVSPRKSPVFLPEQLKAQFETWRSAVKNDFEKQIFRKYPVIATIKEALYGAGAVYASMSGSGAAVYGIFREKPELLDLERDCRVFYDVG